MERILCVFIIIITVFILYYINLNFQLSETHSDDFNLKVNILSDCIAILSKEDCPYCEDLKNQLKQSNKQYTIITLKNNLTFDFDNTFSDLTPAERDSIIIELQKVISPGNNVFFPTIINKDKIYFGLPKKQIINEIFNM